MTAFGIFMVPCSGQDLPVGAQSAGMAGITVMVDGIWSVMNNPAGLAGLDRPAAGTGAEQRYVLKETGVYALGAAMPVLGGGLGLGLTFEGYHLYRSQRLALAFGRHFGPGLAAGISLSYYHARPGNDYPATHRVGYAAGIVVKLSARIEAGFFAMNPFRFYYRSAPYVTLPSVIRAGLLYHYSSNLRLHAELEKDSELPPSFRAGCELAFRERFFIRSGFRLMPVEYAFGAGFRNRGLMIDISSAYHQYLGFTPGITIQYEF